MSRAIAQKSFFRVNEKIRPWIALIAFCAGSGTFVALLLNRAGATTGFADFLLICISTAVLIWAGELFFIGCRLLPPLASLPALTCTGLAVVSLTMLPLVIYGGIVAATAFKLVAVGVVALRATLHDRIRPTLSQYAYRDVLMTFAFALLVYWFCRSIASALPDISRDGVLHAWLDYAVHGTQIAEFGDRLAAGRGTIMMVGAPRGFYHYGIFMLPSALLPMSGLPGLGIATAILLPVGLLVAYMGTYVLCTELGDRTIGALAVLATGFLPDPSTYWLRDGFFAFRWLMFTAPGSGYAIGIGAVAFVFMLQGMRGITPKRSYAASFCLMGTLIMIRAHMFLLAAPAITAAVIIYKFRGRLSRYAVAVGTVGFLLVLAFSFGATAREFWSHNVDALFQFLDFNDHQIKAPAYLDLVRSLTASHGRNVAALIQVPLVTFISLGVFSVLFPLAAAAACKRRTVGPEYLLLATLIVSFTFLVAFAPAAGNNDFTEYKQRHFVFLYAIVGASSLALLMKESQHRFSLLGKSVDRWVVLLCLGAALAISVFGRSIDPGRPSFSLGVLYDAPVEPCMVQIASYIGQHARPNDVISIGGADDKGLTIDQATMLVSLVDIPAFVGRAAVQITHGGATRQLALDRTALVAAIDESPSSTVAMNLLKNQGISWYVRTDGQTPRWDLTGNLADMRCGSERVYQVGAH
ncbi:hypothetical protein [Paraburkholderia hospita]|uniref:hypothetical protein n=1 Tax=Paraburkholderia hospita TaxID=169430 RepID=UPI000B346B14|nr:hypothetical protein [Paraburkholderia hospita]OUL82344.1 hypothetical protein CA603_28530 [Paraburkholderia hospita]